MFLRILLLLAVLSAGVPGVAAPKAKEAACPPPPPYTGPKKRLAVMDMDVKVTTTTSVAPNMQGGMTSTSSIDIPMPTDFGQGLTEMLTTALVGTKRYILVERKALADIQAEQVLGASGMVSDDSAAKAGHLLGAQVLVRGAVTEYTFRRSASGGSASLIPGVSLAKSSAEAAVVLDIRLYDANTGQILDSVKAEGRAKGSAAGIGLNLENLGNGDQDLNLSFGSVQQTPLGQATREAIEKAVYFIACRMDTVPWEATVAEMDGDAQNVPITLYLNAGEEMGIKVGDVLDIYRPGRAITDPKTKVVIGRTRDQRLGLCRIETTTPTLAFALPIEGAGFAVNDIVRYPISAPPASSSTR